MRHSIRIKVEIIPTIRPVVISSNTTPKSNPHGNAISFGITPGIDERLEIDQFPDRHNNGCSQNGQRQILKEAGKNRLTTTINKEDNTPAKGVLAPASALTTVRDRLPVTGKAELIPALILATPSAISS